MKIVFIGQKGIPAVSGGVETHVEALAKRLASRGHDVVAYTRYNYSDRKQRMYEGVRLVNLPSISTKNLDAIVHTFLAILHTIIFERRVDVIHFHSIGPSSLIWIPKIFKPFTPIVATFHTQCYTHKKWGGFARRYLRFGEFMANRLADEVIVISKTLQEYAQKKYQRMVTYIPNGVASACTKEADIIKKWDLLKDNYILTVSRLVRHKGIHHIIGAFRALDTDKKLVIVGDGSYTDSYIEELRALAAGDERIIFTGQQSGDALRELFSNAYLFVQASESEGLSIALLEAMSYELPVLASDIPENAEALRQTGFYFENGNADSLREMLAKLLAKRELADAKRSQAKARVRLNYDWDTIVRETEKLYQKALVEKSMNVTKQSHNSSR